MPGEKSGEKVKCKEAEGRKRGMRRGGEETRNRQTDGQMGLNDNNDRNASTSAHLCWRELLLWRRHYAVHSWFTLTTELSLESTVFVAFADKGLNIQCALKIPANYSQDSLMCYDVSDREICKLDTPSTGNQGTTFKPKLELKNLTSSGEYYCRYKAVRVYWFLRVIHGYKHVEVSDYMFISVSVLTSMLLVFSVVGSVYVFRGHWKESTSDPGNTDRKRKNSRQERKQSEEKEDNMNVTSSSSFYASLEPRPRSIYDVLDRSAVTTEPHQGKAKPKKEPQKTTVQTSQPQQEGVFESIYENF